MANPMGSDIFDCAACAASITAEFRFCLLACELEPPAPHMARGRALKWGEFYLLGQRNGDANAFHGALAILIGHDNMTAQQLYKHCSMFLRKAGA